MMKRSLGTSIERCPARGERSTLETKDSRVELSTRVVLWTKGLEMYLPKDSRVELRYISRIEYIKNVIAHLSTRVVLWTKGLRCSVRKTAFWGARS